MTVISQKLTYRPAIEYARRLRCHHGFVWLDSARYHQQMGRYSYLGVDPFAEFYGYQEQVVWQGETYPCDDALGFLQTLLNRYGLQTDPGLPPLQSGVMGYFSYELNQQLEPRHLSDTQSSGWPLIALGFYDLVLAFDHYQQTVWALSSGLPETDADKRSARAVRRLRTLVDISRPRFNEPDGFETVEPTAIESNFTPKTYRQAVQSARDYILNGDIFEVNLSQRFRCRLPGELDHFALYEKLRVNNPAPFAAYVELGDHVVLSASPERFIEIRGDKVQTRPIKGTAPRSDDGEEDRANAQALLASDKDWAENTMIVDLMRNDLSRVCGPGTIDVPQLCGLESFETVHHLVSVVEGRLSRGNDAVSLLKASFPGGSITGAPKVRSMEIIEELEPTPRGPYCGSIGFIGFDGSMDTSIVIRTMFSDDEWLSWQAGGAVVLDSDPEGEYQETLTKGRALMHTLTEG